MIDKKTHRLGLYLVGFVALWESIHLVWEHLNGGIQSHHLLAMQELPAISNWWGLIILPILAWFLAGSIQKRMDQQKRNNGPKKWALTNIVIGGFTSLIYGGLLSYFFTIGNENITSYLFFGMLLIAIIFPIFRAEILLGFILGMTFTFGTVLPMIVGIVVTSISAFVHLLIVPTLRKILTMIKRDSSKR